MATEQHPTLMSVQQASARLAVSEMTVLRMIGRHELRAARVGKQWRIPCEDVERMATPPATAPALASSPGRGVGAASQTAPRTVEAGTTAMPDQGKAIRIFRNRPWEDSHAR